MPPEICSSSRVKWIIVISWSAVLTCGLPWAGSENNMAGEPNKGGAKAAAPYTEYVVSQITVAPGEEAGTVATCPDPSIVVGGGFDGVSSMTVYAQGKHMNGWFADARNDFFFDRPLTVYAVCLHDAPGASVDQEIGYGSVLDHLFAYVYATCPAGSIVTGGGFTDESRGEIDILHSKKATAAEAWEVYAENDTNFQQELRVYAVCLSGLDGWTRQVEKSTPVPASSSGFAKPACESDELVTCGGFNGRDGIEVYISSGPHTADQDEWHVYGLNTSLSESRTLFGYAICATLVIFTDGFEAGDTSRWSATVP